MATEPSFLSLASEKSVRARATKIALIVGSILALINHGDRLVAMSLDGTAVLKIVLTFLVPYCVSTYSSVQAMRERMRG